MADKESACIARNQLLNINLRSFFNGASGVQLTQILDTLFMATE